MNRLFGTHPGGTGCSFFNPASCLALCLFFLTSSISAAEPLTERVLQTFADGTKAVTGQYHKEKMIERIYYRPDGKVRRIENMLSGSVRAFSYYDNGRPRMQLESLDGLPEGTWIIWFSDGRKFSESHFRKGRIIFRKEWDENGNIVRVQNAGDF